jgi:transglycosylase-like protein
VRKSRIAVIATTLIAAVPAVALAANAVPEIEQADSAQAVGPFGRPEARLMKTIEVELGEMRRQRRKALYANLPGGVSRETLEAIAACESGGDPAIVSSDGLYRGKYQFSVDTWASVGGHGDPAAAPEAEQDYRAALLYSRSGSSPWPVCGV